MEPARQKACSSAARSRSFYETNEFHRVDRRNGNAQGPLEFSSPKQSIRLVASLVDLCSRGDDYVDKLTLKGFLRSRYDNSPYVSTWCSIRWVAPT